MKRKNSIPFLVSWLTAVITMVSPSLGAPFVPDIPIVSTRPGSASVFFLDFRGGSIQIPEVMEGALTNFEPAVLSNPMMQKIVERVAEYYAPFDVNITTNPSHYAPPAATVGHRMRCIIALREQDGGLPPPETNGIGGVASLGSFSGSSLGYPASGGFSPGVVCWVSCQPTGIDADEGQQIERVGDTIAHELGHTLGLSHWGTTANASYPFSEYYPNSNQGQIHGAISWAPLMGQFNQKSVRQWSKGEYNRAARFNSGNPIYGLGGDLSIIASTLASGAYPSGYLSDDKGNDRASSAALTLAGKAPSDGGVISSETDEDFFKIVTVTPGSIRLEVRPAFANHALDIFAELQNSAGVAVASDNNLDSRGKTLSVLSLPSGTYYLRVRGNEQGDPATNGWSRYGSIGTYRITGKINGGTTAPELLAPAVATIGSVGVAYSFNLQATNNPTSYYATSGTLPPGILLGSGGIVSGTPTLVGSYTLNLTAENAAGASSKTFTFKIVGAVSLPEALDSVQQDWSTTSPPSDLAGTLWQGQSLYSADGADSARSGAIGANSESILTSTVQGPGKLTFDWGTSCASGDRLLLKINGVEQPLPWFGAPNNTGAFLWEQKVVTITTPGPNIIDWIYRTDAGTTAGQNAGFVDRVYYLRTPQFPVLNFYAAARAGHPWGLLLQSLEPITGWSLTGGALPPGIVLNTTTGYLSGTPTTIGTYEPEFTASNAAGTSTNFPSIYIYPDVSLPVALDANGLIYATGGDNPWFGDTTPTNDGVDAAHSGPIRHNQTSWMETTVTGPGNFSFWWKASTQATGDPVYFSVLNSNRVVQTTINISGEIDWQQRSYSLGAGTHTLRWEYVRNNSGGDGQNMAWVDLVSWITPGPTITSPLTVNWTCGQSPLIFLTSDDPNTIWTTGTLPAGVSFAGSPVNAIGGNPKRPGTVSFNIMATNAGGTTTTRLFTANIESSYAAWARSKGLAVGTELGDPDKDGIPNIAELAYALDPLVRNNGFSPIGYDPVTKRLRAIFQRKHQFYPDLKYEVQTSNNLTVWDTIAHVSDGANIINVSANSVSEVQLTATPPDYNYEVTVKDGTAQSAATPKRYMRLKITQQ